MYLVVKMFTLNVFILENNTNILIEKWLQMMHWQKTDIISALYLWRMFGIITIWSSGMCQRCGACGGMKCSLSVRAGLWVLTWPLCLRDYLAVLICDYGNYLSTVCLLLFLCVRSYLVWSSLLTCYWQTF